MGPAVEGAGKDPANDAALDGHAALPDKENL